MVRLDCDLDNFQTTYFQLQNAVQTTQHFQATAALGLSSTPLQKPAQLPGAVSTMTVPKPPRWVAPLTRPHECSPCSAGLSGAPLSPLVESSGFLRKLLLHDQRIEPLLVSSTHLYLSWEDSRNSGLVSGTPFHTCLAATLALNLATSSYNWISYLFPTWLPRPWPPGSRLGHNLYLSNWNELSFLRNVPSSFLFSTV